MMSWARLVIIFFVICVASIFLCHRIRWYNAHARAIEWCKVLDQEIDELVAFGFSESDSVVKRLRQIQKERLWCTKTYGQRITEYVHNLVHMQTKLLHDMQHTVFEFHHLNVPNDHDQLNFMRVQIVHETDNLHHASYVTQDSYVKQLDGLKIQYKQAIAYYKNEIRAYLMHGFDDTDVQIYSLKRKLAGNVKGYYRYAWQRTMVSS